MFDDQDLIFHLLYLDIDTTCSYSRLVAIRLQYMYFYEYQFNPDTLETHGIKSRYRTPKKLARFLDCLRSGACYTY